MCVRVSIETDRRSSERPKRSRRNGVTVRIRRDAASPGHSATRVKLRAQHGTKINASHPGTNCIRELWRTMAMARVARTIDPDATRGTPRGRGEYLHDETRHDRRYHINGSCGTAGRARTAWNERLSADGRLQHRRSQVGHVELAAGSTLLRAWRHAVFSSRDAPGPYGDRRLQPGDLRLRST